MSFSSDALVEDLDDAWEVLAEPVQTVMRRHGISEPYEKLKHFTRGNKITREAMRDFVENESDLPESGIALMDGIQPSTYTGNAELQARRVRSMMEPEHLVLRDSLEAGSS